MTRLASWACVLLCGAIACRARPSDDRSQASVPPERISTPSQGPSGVVYVCPMDPDVRSNEPGVCRRCGMKLAAGVPDPVEFHLDLASTPPAPAPGHPSALRFLVRDPWKERPVTTFTMVHEKLFHAFVVSQDLEFFEHGHPSLEEDGAFELPIVFPRPGMY